MKDINWGKIKGEGVDLLHFVISMALTSGMNADELHYRYLQKNAENHARQEGLVKWRMDYKPKGGIMFAMNLRELKKQRVKLTEQLAELDKREKELIVLEEEKRKQFKELNGVKFNGKAKKSE